MKTKAFFILFVLQGSIMLSAFQVHAQAAVGYTQEQIFNTIILPTFRSYPEIAWFADPGVYATNEGTADHSTPKSWTRLLIEKGLLTPSDKKYIELERMLHSVVCFKMLIEGSNQAYAYWVQAQNDLSTRLTRENFNEIHRLTKKYTDNPETLQAIEASLVYSDLGKTPEAKRRAKDRGITQADHDDFMEALYSASPEIRAAVIPSFEKLPEPIQKHILTLHLAVPLHWGHVLHLEGGQGMFARLVTSQEKYPSSEDLVEQAFLIQLCDVAAQMAHNNLKGSVSLNEPTYLGYHTVLAVIKQLLITRDTKMALLDFADHRAMQLGFVSSMPQSESFVLARMAAFLRLYSKEEGKHLLRAVFDRRFQSEEWALIQTMFGVDSGVNTWTRNPTYMPAFVLNLFNASKDPSEKYQRALNGMLTLAKIANAYQEKRYQLSETPLCFNPLAGQATKNPEWFESFDASQIIWDNPQALTIQAPAPSNVVKLNTGM